MTAPGGKLHATPDQLRAAAAIANAKADEIDSLVATTNQRVDQMEATWEGLAPGAFDPLQLQWTNNMTQMTNRLREHAKSLTDASVTQDLSDISSKQVLNGVSTPMLNLH